MEGRIHVLLFGKSGSGKSTITNMLLKERVAKTDDTLKGVTLECKQYKSDNSPYIVTDTIGIGETKFGSIPHDEAIKKLQCFISTLDRPLHHVCFIKEAGTFDKVDKAFWNAFEAMFGGCKRNFIMIITKSKDGWASQNANVIQAFTGDIDIIDVNFPETSSIPVEESVFCAIRQNSLMKLNDLLSEIRSRPGYSTVIPKVDMSAADKVYGYFNNIDNIEKKKKEDVRSYNHPNQFRNSSQNYNHYISQIQYLCECMQYYGKHVTLANDIIELINKYNRYY